MAYLSTTVAKTIDMSIAKTTMAVRHFFFHDIMKIFTIVVRTVLRARV